MSFNQVEIKIITYSVFLIIVNKKDVFFKINLKFRTKLKKTLINQILTNINKENFNKLYIFF